MISETVIGPLAVDHMAKDARVCHLDGVSDSSIADSLIRLERRNAILHSLLVNQIEDPPRNVRPDPGVRGTCAVGGRCLMTVSSRCWRGGCLRRAPNAND